jgi:hypothetical protein
MRCMDYTWQVHLRTVVTQRSSRYVVRFAVETHMRILVRVWQFKMGRLNDDIANQSQVTNIQVFFGVTRCFRTSYWSDDVQKLERENKSYRLEICPVWVIAKQDGFETVLLCLVTVSKLFESSDILLLSSTDSTLYFRTKSRLNFLINGHGKIGFEVNMKNAVFWVVTSCSLETVWFFGGTFHPYIRGRRVSQATD